MVERMRMWCMKVLPLVYEDSLSYYETLCKVVAKLNEVITQVNGLVDGAMDAYIDRRFNDLFMDAAYNAETETLTLKMKHKEAK